MKTKLLTLMFVSFSLAACRGDSGSSGNGGGGSGGGSSIDACKIITQADAATLFGQPATYDEPTVVSYTLGACNWAWDDSTATDPPSNSQLLQFYVYDGVQGYSAPSDSTPYTIGDEGYLRLIAGVEIGWKQSNMNMIVDFSTIGTGVPDALTKQDEVKDLAQRAAATLASGN